VQKRQVEFYHGPIIVSRLANAFATQDKTFLTWWQGGTMYTFNCFCIYYMVPFLHRDHERPAIFVSRTRVRFTWFLLRRIVFLIYNKLYFYIAINISHFGGWQMRPIHTTKIHDKIQHNRILINTLNVHAFLLVGA
jgi:hypothetical protein